MNEHERLSICEEQEATYDHRVYNPDQHNFCSVHESGFDAVLFVAIGVICTCLAPRKHYAIVMLILGALLQLLNIEVNIRELSNALNLWIGIRPAKMFFYIFLPPLLLDSAVRIDFFIFKKVMSQVFVFAFGVVAINTVLLAVFMLYVLNLRNEGWEWTDAFLFACMIASTDALAVTAIMKDGAGPEKLIILAEGESLFNDATSIVFFDLFWPRFKDSIKGTLKHESIAAVVFGMALDVLWLAVGGALIGVASGFVTQVLFKWLQNRHGHSPVSEVGITVGISYLCYYMAESVVEVSGVIAVVVYGLYGAATTQWDISPSARESGVFNSFWDVTQLLTNGIVFFYAGASATNFFYRCEEDLFEGSNADAWSTIFAWLPGVYVGIFLLRFLEIAIVAPVVGYFGCKLKINEIVFISLAGLRGALALILAQELLQYEFPDEPDNDFESEKKVRAQSALWVCGFVLLTLVINAPGIPFLLKICGLEHLSPMQLQYRKKSEDALHEYTQSWIAEKRGDANSVPQGVNWQRVEAFILGHGEVPHGNSVQPAEGGSNGVRDGVVDHRWELVESISHKAPLIPSSQAPQIDRVSPMDSHMKGHRGEDAPFGGASVGEKPLLGDGEDGERTEPMIPTGGSSTAAASSSGDARTNKVILVLSSGTSLQFLECSEELPHCVTQHMEPPQAAAQEETQKFFASPSCYFNIVRRLVDEPSMGHPEESSSKMFSKTVAPSRIRGREEALPDSTLTVSLLEAGEPNSAPSDDGGSYKEQQVTQARFRMLMGLKKYFQDRRTNGYLSSQVSQYTECRI